jgi:predicted RNase H-like nuclease
LSDEFIADATADRLDALLCAIQSAWAWTQRDQNFGVPVDADPAEGWIVDPGLVNDSTDAAGKGAGTGS